jgi:hypothetical protein
MLLALNIREWLVADARARVLRVDDTASLLLRVFVLPYLTWLVLSSLFLFVLAERLRVRAVCRAKQEDDAPAWRGLPRRASPVPAAAVEGAG